MHTLMEVSQNSATPSDTPIQTSAPSQLPKIVKVDSVPQLLIPNEPLSFRVTFLIVKYVFIVTNLMGAVVSLYLLCSDEGIEWNSQNALKVLGLMFFIILAVVALFGAIKEECYIVLTYDLFIVSMAVITIINVWSVIYQSLLIVLYVCLCLGFAYLLYRKHPSPSI
ncbi:hypothetical protein B4U79_07764 [Dinothrombium tinctorium]|uniref:MARVEL domain-containing protein n=1 Tax=Dinothrombium tinctorium TaxID=1965070 RepID=A0A3S3RT34_9ACAR|nr:hypothetical protein B4U79_15990 [Dinothrombium tinctorium]RWS04338.1 hypothetical protein B4U79_07764 [Dinothrombium tinctorium]